MRLFIWGYHPQAILIGRLCVREGERERSRLDVDFLSDLENGFEPNALLADVPCRVLLAAHASTAYGLHMLFLKAILI